MEGQKKVFVLGASNVDIIGYPHHKLIMKDANLGDMKISAGGVGRNIAHNLKLLGFDVHLASLFGDDPLSKFLIKNCQENGLNISTSLVVKNQTASSFIAILDHSNDLALGISAMEIYNEKNALKLIKVLPEKINAHYMILETNYPEKALNKIIQKYPRKKFVLDTVSGPKAQRSLKILNKLYILKTNLLEAQNLSGIEVKKNNYDDLVKYFLDKGVKKVFITLGKDGVVFGEKNTIFHKKPIQAQIVNTIGAGDSFVAGLILADSLSMDIEKTASFGMAAASITVQSKLAVNPELSYKNILSVLRN